MRLVAIVDDDPGVCRSIARFVRSLGHETRVFGSGDELLCGMGPRAPTDILLDLHMPGLSGPPLVSQIRIQWPAVRILVMSGFETRGASEDCLEAGATLFASKPMPPHEIRNFLAPVAPLGA